MTWVPYRLALVFDMLGSLDVWRLRSSSLSGGLGIFYAVCWLVLVLSGAMCLLLVSVWHYVLDGFDADTLTNLISCR